MGPTPAFSATVVEVLREDNYLDWSVRVKTLLMAHGLWGIVASPTPANESDFSGWSKTNASALHVIQSSCGPDTFSHIRLSNTAKDAWETLARKFEPKDHDPSTR